MVGTAGLYVLCLEWEWEYEKESSHPVIRQLLGRQDLGGERELGASRQKWFAISVWLI